MTPSLTCPYCGSSNIFSRDYAKKLCGALGAALGTALSLAAAVAMSRRVPVPSLSANRDLISTANVAEMFRFVAVGAATGYTAGVKLGMVIDEHFIENFECKSCGHAFKQHDPDHIGI